MVLYQDKSPALLGKPKISETKVMHAPQAFRDVLPCQVLLEFHKPPQCPDIPAQYAVDDQVYSSVEQNAAHTKDTTWSLACIDFTKNHVTVCPHSQTMPTWAVSNSVWTEENIPVKTIAFLPVLPHPVTEYSTVYSAMKNFISICSQLVQEQIPIYCGEGVYCIKMIHLQVFHI